MDLKNWTVRTRDIETIHHITPKGRVVTVDGRGYKKHYNPDGDRRDTDHYSVYWYSITPLTEELLDEIILDTRKKAIVNFLKSVRWDILSTQRLIKIAEFLGVES